ncbi:MAG TPA: AraC family transcriptional regulator [Saprospiraceae bacterium]|nr:AraC family transcriptional regulator [Saprospiraceae bacterium]
MEIYREITPLHEPDVFVIMDSFNNGFDYPVHNHPEYELNLVVGISGYRIVGDSTERYTDFDLVLLGPYLYHKWDADVKLEKEGIPYRVITIQFAIDLFDVHLFQKESFYKIRKLLQSSSRGIRFHGETFNEAKNMMIELTKNKGFTNIIEFLKLLDLLSQSTETEYLTSEGFMPQTLKSESNRIQVLYSYILKNFSKHDLKIVDAAAIINMSISAFSHFFQKHTTKSFTQFLLDIRISHSCKLLISTDDTISQISYRSGFNNLANFNRLFRKYRFCTPVEYRRRHKEKYEFDWLKQITPKQFVPSNSKGSDLAKPLKYATKLTHL